MNIRRAIFIILAAAASLFGAILLVYAHIDMFEMRTVRSSWNMSGIMAVLSGMVIAGGMVLLLLLWRVLGYDPGRAQSDLKIWICVLWGLLASLHLPFAISISIMEWIEYANGKPFWNTITRFWLSEDGFFVFLALMWPLPVIFGLGKYRAYLIKQGLKLHKPVLS